MEPNSRPSDGQMLEGSCRDLEHAEYLDPCQEGQGLLPWHSLNLTRPKLLFILRLPLSVALIIVRSLGILLLAVFLWFWCLIWTCGAKVPLKPEDPPLSGCRHIAIKFVVRWIGRLALFVSGFYWIPVTRHKGSIARFTMFASEDERADIVVCNHVSPLGDILYNLFAHCPGFVAKAAVAEIPFIGTIATSIQSIFISRSSKSSKAATKELLIRRGLSGSAFPPILIFPEGTTTNGVSVAQFKVGAFLAGAKVQPVALRYPFMNFSPSWSTESALFSLMMTWSQCWNCMEVIYLPIYFPDEEEKKNPRLFAANVQKLIADALDVPCSNYSLEEFPKEHVELRAPAGEQGWKQWELSKHEQPPFPRVLTDCQSPLVSPTGSPPISRTGSAENLNLDFKEPPLGSQSEHPAGAPTMQDTQVNTVQF